MNWCSLLSGAYSVPQHARAAPWSCQTLFIASFIHLQDNILSLYQLWSSNSTFIIYSVRYTSQSLFLNDICCFLSPILFWDTQFFKHDQLQKIILKLLIKNRTTKKTIDDFKYLYFTKLIIFVYSFMRVRTL